MLVTMKTVTKTDIGLAKAVLEMNASSLADRLGVGVATIRRIESPPVAKAGGAKPREVSPQTLSNIRESLDTLLAAHGWEIIEEGGIRRLPKSGISPMPEGGKATEDGEE